MHSDPYTYRPACFDDMADVHALWSDCQFDLTGQRSIQLSDFESWWRSPGFDLGTSTQVVLTPDGRLVGYAVLIDLDPVPVAPFLNARVHPTHEGRGIGTRLLQWGEETAHRVLDRLEPDLRVALVLCRFSHHGPSRDLFEDHGFATVRHSLELDIQLDDSIATPRWAPGIRVIPWSEHGDLGAMLDAKREAFEDHWGVIPVRDPLEEERWRHGIATGADHPDLWYLAMDGDEIAGVCLCTPRCPSVKGAAYVDTVAVRRDWRRRGIALALLLHAFHELRRRGHTRAALSVDADNLTGATRLYEKAGMSLLISDDTWEKELRPGRDARNLGEPSSAGA